MAKRTRGRIDPPTEDDWNESEGDLDVAYFYRLVFGKSFDEVALLFHNNAIERASELLFAPRKVFQYYVLSFCQYLLSNEAEGASDAASPFLHLLENREKRDPGSVKEIFESLEQCVDFVATRQTYFDAPEDVYGNFQEQAQRIRRVCAA